MKRLFSLNSKTLALLGYFFAVLLLLVARILSAERSFGPNTDAWYQDFFVLASQTGALFIPFLTFTVLSARRDEVNPLRYHRFLLRGLAIPLIIAFSVLQYVLNSGVAYAWSALRTLIGHTASNAPIPVPTELGDVLLALLMQALLPALMEEGVSRGLVGRAFSGASKRTQILISALLFGLFHQNFAQFGYTFVSGAWLFAVYYATGSLLAPVVVHFVNNAFSVLIPVLSTEGSVFLTCQAFFQTHLGMGVYVVLMFLSASAMVGIIRLLERKKYPVPFQNYESDRDNSFLFNIVLGAILVLGVLATVYSLVSGVIM